MNGKEYLEKEQLLIKLENIPILKDYPHLMAMCKEWVNDCDSEIFAPTKYGHWEEENRRERSSQFICSSCGGKAWYPQATNTRAKREKMCLYSYCPRCGAWMEGEI